MSEKISVDEMKKQFRAVPKPVKQKVVKDLVAAHYSQMDIARMFGVTGYEISKLYREDIHDESLKHLQTEVTKLNDLKDVQIKALVKDLELTAYKKLSEGVKDAKYADVLRTAEMLKTFTSQNLTQNNINIVMPDSVKKKFNVNLPVEPAQPDT